MRRADVLVPGGIVLGVVGGLILGWRPLLGGLLSVVGGATALFSYWASKAQAGEYENFMEAQAVLLAKGGLGNALTESVTNELRKGGWARGVSARLRKALELTPDDVETLELLSTTLALVLSFRSWVLRTSSGPRFREAIAEAKGYAEKGHELAPQSHVLLSSLGILCDLEGEHEQARDYFRRGGELGLGPYWRLHASTSWSMEGRSTQALAEVEKAVEEGAKGYVVDFYRGRALNDLARYDEAFPYLHRAYRARGMRPELLRHLGMAANFSGRALAAAKYQCLLGFAMLRPSPRRGLVTLLLAIPISSLGVLGVLSKKLWGYTRRVPVVGRLHGRLLSPDEPEATVLLRLAGQREYDAALLLAKRALQARPDKSENHETVVMLLANTRDRSGALAACDRALKSWPNHPRLRSLCRTVAEEDHEFRCVPLPSGGGYWRVAERGSGPAVSR